MTELARNVIGFLASILCALAITGWLAVLL